MKKEIGFELRKGAYRAFILFELNSYAETDQISCEELYRTDDPEGKILANTRLYNYLKSVARYNFNAMPFLGRRINYTEDYLIGMSLFDDGSNNPVNMDEALGGNQDTQH